MSAEDVKQQVRGHMRIFAIVLVLAVASATLSMISDAPVVTIVMLVAAVQASLILAFLMHVRHEGKTIQWLLAISAFFLVVLFGLTMLARADPLAGTEIIQPSVTAPTEEH